MIWIEMPSLDFAMETSLFAVFLGLVVLLPLFEKTMRCVVMCETVDGIEWIWSGAVRFWLGAVAGVKLFENLATSL